MLWEGACNGHSSIFWHAVHLHPSRLSSSSSGMPSLCLIYEPKHEVQAVSMRPVSAGYGPAGTAPRYPPSSQPFSLSPAALSIIESWWLEDPPTHASQQPRSTAANVNAYEPNSALGQVLPPPQAGTSEKLPHYESVHAHKSLHCRTLISY